MNEMMIDNAGEETKQMEAMSAIDRREATRKKVIFSAYELGRIVDTSVEPIEPSTELREVDDFFNMAGVSEFLPVIHDDNILGYIKKDKFKARLGQNHFARDIFLKDGVTASVFMDDKVIVLDSYQNLSEASKVLMERDADHLYDPFVITHEGKYLGISSVKKVMDGINYYQKKDFEASQEAQLSIMAAHDYTKQYNVEFDIVNEQLGMVGGDYVFSHWINPHLSLFILLDVCGKGLKASNMLMSIGSFIKHKLDANEERLAKLEHSSFGLVPKVNRLNYLVALNTPTDMYATGVFLLIDTKNMVLQYMNYGHPDVYLARKGGGTVIPSATEVETGMFPFFGIEPNLLIKSQKIKIQQGDVFFTFTDGVNEARNNLKEEFTEERVQELVRQNQNLSTKEINTIIYDAIQEFKQGYRTIDDTSMLSIKVL